MTVEARFVVIAEGAAALREEGRFASYGEAFCHGLELLPSLCGGFVRIVERGPAGDHVRVVMR